MTTAVIASLEWLTLGLALWLVYLRWRFGPCKHHALALWRWHCRRRREAYRQRMRPVVQARRQWHRHDEYFENMPPGGQFLPTSALRVMAITAEPWLYEPRIVVADEIVARRRAS